MLTPLACADTARIHTRAVADIDIVQYAVDWTDLMATRVDNALTQLMASPIGRSVELAVCRLVGWVGVSRPLRLTAYRGRSMYSTGAIHMPTMVAHHALYDLCVPI